MTYPKEEFERFDRKSKFPYQEPLDPDELLKEETQEHIALREIHLSSRTITPHELKVFLHKIQPHLQSFLSLNHEEKQQLAHLMNQFKKLIKKSNVSKEINHSVEEMVAHIHALLKHYKAEHHSSALFALQKILNRL